MAPHRFLLVGACSARVQPLHLLGADRAGCRQLHDSQTGVPSAESPPPLPMAIWLGFVDLATAFEIKAATHEIF